MVSKTKKIKLKYLLSFSTHANTDFSYDWNTLTNSLEENGYDTENNNPIIVCHFYKGYYVVFDGHHRIKLLKELYDDEHEIIVSHVKFFKMLFTLIGLMLFQKGEYEYLLYNKNLKEKNVPKKNISSETNTNFFSAFIILSFYILFFIVKKIRFIYDYHSGKLIK